MFNAYEDGHRVADYTKNMTYSGDAQRQTAVTADLKSQQSLLFVFELQDSLLPSSTGILTAMQRQTAVAAYLKREQLLPFNITG